jgi:hypothetical protein
MDHNDLLNISQAAKAAGVAEMTIRKYLGITKPPQESRLPNARKEIRAGQTIATWAIPLSDLINAGLMSKVTSEPAPAATEQEASTSNLALLKLEMEVTSLKAQLEEKERLIALYDQQLTFANRLQLETSQVQEERRKFWQRKK